MRNLWVGIVLISELRDDAVRRSKLVTLANYGKEDRPDPIVPKINQTILAEMIGTGRSHVNHFMNKFRQLGLIEYNGDARGEIKVNRSLLNLLLHEKPQIAQRD